MLALISEELAYTDAEAATIIHSLIYGLATDIIYSHLQHYETTPLIRKKIRESLGICTPDLPTPWHQDILSPSELPDFTTVEKTDTNDIMNMVKRWTVTSTILFLRNLVGKKQISPEDAYIIDEYLVNTLMPLNTYTFDDAQKDAILNDTNRKDQLQRLSSTRREIREKKPGYTSALLYALFHQTMTQHILNLLDAEQMPACVKKELKELHYFALPKKPKNKKGAKGRRK
jgi:hypothetical protein